MMGVVEYEIPYYLLLCPPVKIEDLHDLSSRGAYEYNDP